MSFIPDNCITLDEYEEDMKHCSAIAQRRINELKGEIREAYITIWILLGKLGGQVRLTPREIVAAPRDAAVSTYRDPSDMAVVLATVHEPAE